MDIPIEDEAQPTFDDLYERHHLGAYRFALGLCAGEAALAEDAVSEAFVLVYPKWLAGRVAKFEPYLRRAVANQVKAAFRHRGVERRHQATDDARHTFDEDMGRRDQLLQALAALPLKQRTAVVLFYYEDQPLEGVAETMGTTVGTAKAHLSRGRDRLRQLLEGQA